ncbi:hypothetical protein [Aminobacter ciceronei]|uniref:hypothetical protein n=1 Tax=Aminobacter ciceronei TaxID=150723 RepID=UPI0015FC49E7|nr:hypothetical protein [Aminobacter ciceronei]
MLAAFAPISKGCMLNKVFPMIGTRDHSASLGTGAFFPSGGRNDDVPNLRAQDSHDSAGFLGSCGGQFCFPRISPEQHPATHDGRAMPATFPKQL